MPQAVSLPEELRFRRDHHGFLDDFSHVPDTTNDYDLIAPDTGSVTAIDALEGGITVSPSDATVADNDEVYLARKQESFKLADGRPIHYECLCNITDAGSDTLNAISGLADAVAANLLQDNGGGPKASGEVICFYAKDGNTNWHVYIRLNGNLVIDKELDGVNNDDFDAVAHDANQSSNQRLEIQIVPKAASKADITFLIDGVTVYKQLDVDYSTTSDMQAVFGAKNGDANHQEQKLFFHAAYQRR
jgi:hypothetical protein